MSSESQDKETVDSIIATLRRRVEDREVITPESYINAAERLNILLEDEEDRLYELENIVNNIKVDYIDDENSVAAAEAKTEATREYKEMRKLKAKCERIKEQIRLAKKHAQLKVDQLINSQ